MIDRPALDALVAAQLAMIRDPARREALRARMVEPWVEEREWDYGEPGERYPYWVVAAAPERWIILVHCEQGFGPDRPWGFLPVGEPETASLGMDAQWNWYLEEAFVRAGLWPGGAERDEAFHLPPEKRFAGGDGPGT
ncbi:MAG: hypothetical protein JO306_05475 [Gemmatimonadetes bacterium]|nr:hypothetical protein [Gemmatimonadota bacterium]